MAIDLLFSQTPASNGALVFGGDTDGPVSLDATLALSGSLPELTGTVQVGVDTPVISLAAGLPELTGTFLITSVGVSTLVFVGQLPGLTGEFELAAQLPVSVTLAGELPGLTGTISLVEVPRASVTFAGSIAELSGEIGVRYDSRTERPEVCSVRNRWQNGQDLPANFEERYQRGQFMPTSAAGAWSDALPLDTSTEMGWGQALRTNRPSLTGRYQEAMALRTSATSSRFQTGIPTHIGLTSGYEEGVRVSPGFTTSWQEAYRDRRDLKVSRYEEALRLQALAMAAMASHGDPLFGGFGVRYQPAMRPPAGMWIRPSLPPAGNPCYTPSGALLFEVQWAAAMEMVFICERHGTVPPAPGATVVVPVRRVYIVINNATLRRVDGNIQLPVFNMSLSLDVDSWAWSFSAALPGVALPDLEPSESGAPVEVEAMINGVAYRALVERIGRERSFGKSDIRVSGRGKTALLDSPYAPARNFLNSGARTAQQIMGDVLSGNGVPMDWTVDWGLTDWTVPAGVFAHQGSYISALNTIAAAAGGYVQPHASLQTLHILPRYPTAPWEWDSATPDFALPSDVTTREGIEWVERARYNRVFVSGQQSGILGQVTRAGTAGDLLAPMVTDALITSAVAARQRGISILANTGRQAEINLRLPVLAETGVITPGKFVQYIDAGVSRMGIVRSTGVEVGMPEIWQTLGVQTYA